MDEKLIQAAEHFDWGQPGARWEPCFHLGSDGHFCGRAPWWDGHVGGSSHDLVTLADLLRSYKPYANLLERQEKCIEIGFKYWRSPDAHGVTCTRDQAIAFMQEMLGVEVEIKPNPKN